MAAPLHAFHDPDVSDRTIAQRPQRGLVGVAARNHRRSGSRMEGRFGLTIAATGAVSRLAFGATGLAITRRARERRSPAHDPCDPKSWVPILASPQSRAAKPSLSCLPSHARKSLPIVEEPW